jgi:hypothetical protein
MQSYIYIGEKHHAGVKTAILVAFSLSYKGRTRGEISKWEVIPENSEKKKLGLQAP